MTDLHRLRDLVAYALTALTIVHVPLLIGLAALLRADTVAVGALAVLFASVPLAFRLLDRPRRLVGIALAMSLVGQTALLVYVFSGQPWQVEMHFYFFAVLAMLAGFCDSLILLVAAMLIVFHHITLNMIFPAALYPGGGDVFRLGVHSVLVVVEAAMLILFARLTERALEQAALAREQALTGAGRLTELGQERQQQLECASKRNLHLEELLGRFRDAVSTNLVRLGDEARSLDETADAFSQVILHTISETEAVVASADSASARVAEVASSGRDYLGTMSMINGNTLTSAQMGQSAVTEAAAATATIDQLTTMSLQIGEAIQLITRIANQTNLLALNATIEAARAGENGRGFAVVASEVKTLSSETTKAAASIATMVDAIQAIADRAATAMSAIVAAIGGLNGATSTIADAVAERVEAAAAMSTNVDVAASDVSRVASAIERIRAVAEESAQSAGFLRSAAGEIANQTHLIRCQVDAFATDLSSLTAENPTTPTAMAVTL